MYEHVRRTCEDLCEHLSNISRTSTVRARILRQCAAGNLGYTTSSDFRCWLGLDRGPRRESRNEILHDLVLTSQFVGGGSPSYTRVILAQGPILSLAPVNIIANQRVILAQGPILSLAPVNIIANQCVILAQGHAT